MALKRLLMGIEPYASVEAVPMLSQQMRVK